MKILIADDDPTSAKLLFIYLKEYGDCHKADNGEEALEAIQHAMESENPYDLICLDIMMPIIDGHETLKTIRELERSTLNITGKTAKVIMTTALNDINTVMRSFSELCDAYIAKPITKEKLVMEMVKIGLIVKH